MRRPWRVTSIALFALTLSGGALFGDRLLALTDEARQSLRLYTELLEVAHARYGREVPYRELVYASVNGMLRNLDPHTAFLAPEDYQTMQEKQQSSFFGLGILVGMRNGQLTVITPIEGTPASRLGVRAGDVISTIEGESTKGMAIDDAVGKLKGPKGTQVNITIARRGVEQPLEMSITRAEIPQTTVRYAYMIDQDTGYLMVSDFARGTSREVAAALAKLKGEGMKRLLVDLRNNGGGLLDQAVDVADQFVPKATTIVETRGRTRDSYQSFKAAGEHPDLAIPVVVLVNGGSASAAEILAGAIQDHDVGLIVGTPTWGKGLVQTVYGLSYGAGLALTTAKYYTPSGRLIQRDYTSYFDYFTHYDATTAGVNGENGENAAPPPPKGPEYKTDLGRAVYGGGGITPDVHVELTEVPELLQFFLTRNAFFDFAVDYQNRTPVKDRSWVPGEETLGALREWLITEKLATPEELDQVLADPAARDYALTRVRAEVFNSAFGQEDWHRVLSSNDQQVHRALSLFDQASDLLARRLDLSERRDAEVAVKDVEKKPKG